MQQLFMALDAYSKRTASELANAFCRGVYSALEVNVGPLTPNCSCTAHFTSSPGTKGPMTMLHCNVGQISWLAA